MNAIVFRQVLTLSDGRIPDNVYDLCDTLMAMNRVLVRVLAIALFVCLDHGVAAAKTALVSPIGRELPPLHSGMLLSWRESGGYIRRGYVDGAPTPMVSPSPSATPRPTSLSPHVVFYSGEAINALISQYHDLAKSLRFTPGRPQLITSSSLSIEINENLNGASLEITDGDSIDSVRSFSRHDRRILNVAQLQLWLGDKLLAGDEAAAFLMGLDYIESHPSPYPAVNHAIKVGQYIAEFFDRGGPDFFLNFSYPDPAASALTSIGCGFYPRMLIFNKATRIIREGKPVC